MEDLLKDWGAVAGYFVIVGLVFEALKRTIRAKAGDKGLKGVWYCWKEVFVVPLGGALGAAGALIEVPNAFGDTIGAGALAGVIGAGLVAFAYDRIKGVVQKHVAHKIARNGDG